MSLIGDVVKVFTGPVEGVISLGEKVWYAIKTIWYVLTTIAELLSGAWDWMVNGAGWLVHQVTHLAEQAGNAVWHVLNVVIPKAIEWAISEAVRYAAIALIAAYNELRSIIASATGFVLFVIYKVAKEAEALGLQIARWATGAVKWVEQFGARVWYLLSHPERLVKWIMGALVGPLVLTLLRLTAPVFGWLFRQWAHHSSDIAHDIEDIISKVV